MVMAVSGIADRRLGIDDWSGRPPFLALPGLFGGALDVLNAPDGSGVEMRTPRRSGFLVGSGCGA